MKKKRKRKLTRPHDDILVTEELITIAENFLDELEENPIYKDIPAPDDILDNVIDMIAQLKREFESDLMPYESSKFRRQQFRLIGSDESPNIYDEEFLKIHLINEIESSIEKATNMLETSDLDEILKDFEVTNGLLDEIMQQLNKLDPDEIKSDKKSKFKLISNSSHSLAATAPREKRGFKPLYIIDKNTIKLHNMNNLKVKLRKNTPILKQKKIIKLFK